ncbi:MAG: LysR family transcriptional regulator [Henriciella sp.]
MDLKKIAHFECVYRLRSFSKAAEELSLTHSALTKSIRSLEATWDTVLFLRTTRSVLPTEAGIRLYPMAERLLALADETKKEAIGVERELTIITGPVVLEAYLPVAISMFREQFPDTRIVAETLPPQRAMQELINRRAHLLLFPEVTLQGMPPPENLILKSLIEEESLVACRRDHPILSREESYEDYFAADWAVPGDYSYELSRLPTEAQNRLKSAGYPKYRLNSLSACLELCMRSDALVLIPKSFAHPFFENGLLSARSHTFTHQFSVSAAALNDSVYERSVDAFISCLETD